MIFFPDANRAVDAYELAFLAERISQTEMAELDNPEPSNRCSNCNNKKKWDHQMNYVCNDCGE